MHEMYYFAMENR